MTHVLLIIIILLLVVLLNRVKSYNLETRRKERAAALAALGVVLVSVALVFKLKIK